MPGPSYKHVYDQRVKDGTAKQTPKDNNSMKIDIEGGYIDATDPKNVKLPPAPRSPIPQDDPLHKYRVETT
jgi:hypothetical protein